MVIAKKWIFRLNNKTYNQIKKCFYYHCCYEFFAYLLITALFLVPTSCSVCLNHKTVFTSKLTGIISDGTSNYLSNQRCEWLIESPDMNKLPFITLTFLNKSTECTYDYIMVYDGDSFKSPRLAALSGDSTSLVQPQKVMATSGKMLIYLFSDINTEHEGFEATFAVYPCPNNCSGNGECKNNICLCDDPWTGSDCSQPACPHNCEDGRGKCGIATSAKKCKCEWEYIGLGCGMSISTRTEGGWWTIVYNYTDETGSGGRAGHAGVFVDPHFYIFGGYNMNMALGDLLSYDFSTNEWSVLYFYKQPTPRFFHTLTVIKDRGQPYLLLAGGDIGHDKLTNETWIYDIFGSSWERPSIPRHYSLPYMCQHAATAVELDGVDYVYVYGGRTAMSQDEGLTSSMYRFNFAKQRWKIVKFDSRGVKESRLRVAAHSMVYDAVDQSLVVFGGFRMDLNHKAEYSSSIFIYRVRENIWAEVMETTSLSRHLPPSLTFHTASIVDNFMVVHGGNTKSNTCFNRETYFYHLRCNKWLQKELSPFIYSRQMVLNSGRYSHVGVIYKNSVLLVHGGYNGIVDGTMLAYKLPQFVTNPPTSQQHARHKCSQHIVEKLCMSDFLSGCTWRGTRCVSSSETMPSCGDICSSMKNCVTCTNFKSYTRNSDYDWEANRCGWCVEDSTCYAMYRKESRGACSSENSRSNYEPWWGKSNYTMIEKSEQCLMEDFPPGVIAAEYFPHPNFTQPDNVTFLHKILYKFGGQEDWPSSGGEYILDVKGFLRPYQIPYEDNIQLKVLVNNGATDLSLSTSSSPADSRNVVFVESNFRDEAVSELIQLSKYSRYFFHLTFSHISDSSWEGNFQAEWIVGSNKPQLLKSSVLEPYGSSTSVCKNFTNCLACLTDISCVWCEAKASCFNRSDLAAHPLWCRMSDKKFDSNHSGMILSPQSCTICSDHPTCQICVTDSICEWREEKCVRRDVMGDGIKEPTFCPKQCKERLDCRSCLTDDTLTNLTTQCYWCDTTQRCYKFASYHLMAYPYGQCGHWMNDIEKCPNCSLHKNCTSCLQQYQCGWCSLSSNPLRGVCFKGEFSKLNSCRRLLFPAANLRETWEWSYSFCPDVDECQLEWPAGTVLHDCKADEDCHNTPDSYECRCKIGFERNGSHCQRTCYEECVHGYCSGPPNYECMCDLGWTSKRNTDLITPTSSIYFQPSACDVDCECNLHSTCSSGPGTCDACRHNTQGRNCSQCLRGYFHNSDRRNGCESCECNGHGVEELGWCDSSTGVCICKDNTEGMWCEMCMEGFYGDARNGGTCYSMCDGKSQITDITGAFGSWEVAEKKTGSLLRRGLSKIEIVKVECEWTIQFSGLLELTIEKNVKTFCYTNPLLIYDGVPGDNNTNMLGGFCGKEWESDVVVYARSGMVTARYSDVPPIIFERPGFNATFHVYPDCPTFDEDSVKSLINSSHNESRNFLITNESIPLMTNITCASVGYPEIMRCESNCSWSLGQGECKNGVCHCFDAYTGPGCTILKLELNATLIEQTEWFPHLFFSNSSPVASIGHSLVALGQNLWLYGGYHYDQGALDQLWSYNTENNLWQKLSDDAEVSTRPGPVYYHAAAKHPTENGFYIHGGILHDGKTSSELWFRNEDDGWSEVKVSRSLPAIAGHTLTFCSETKAYLIGGYSSYAGFSHNVWSLDVTDHSVHTVRSRHIHPPFVYGHSTVCDENLLYVYGGMVKASRLGLPVPTDAFHVFNTTSHQWLPIFLRGENPVVPFARAFHSSIMYESERFRGMLLLGGRSSFGSTLNEVWLFVFICNEWIKLSYEGSRIPSSSPAAEINSKYYICGGLLDGRILKGMKVISDIQPCLRVPKHNCSAIQDDNCLSCICQPSLLINNKNICTNGSITIDGNKLCISKVQTRCSFFRDCKSCLSYSVGNKDENACHWCGIGNSQVSVEGRCLPMHEWCISPDTMVTTRRDCNHCLVPSCYSCKSKSKCSWNESEIMNYAFSKIVKTYSCHAIKTKEYNYYTTSTYDTTPHIPPPAIPMFHDTCPMNCGIFTTCESCLGVRDAHNQWRDCIWSPGLQRCLDPAFVPLLCQPGGHCGTLASHGPKSCPVSSCNLLRFCWHCINNPTCGWLQNGSTGSCVTGSLQGPFVSHNINEMSSAVWWYYQCPLVDECNEGFHDCLDDERYREKCHDLDQGYECLCQNGYDREDASIPCLPVCSTGCINGVCRMPDTCVCEFGFTGERCDIECDCNGHSDCRDAQHLNECLECKHNTTGPQCQHCSLMFVKDPASNNCIPCKEACNGRATNCTSINLSLKSDHGPTLNDIYCIGCKSNSQGNRCEKCKKGFFMLNSNCRPCDCNGHSNICDPETGGQCACRNHTTTSDPRCGMSIHESPPENCWRKQCDQCDESYQGNARSGGQCYRQVSIEQEMCFDISQSSCLSADYSSNSYIVSNENRKRNRALSAGQAILYALSPKYTNVDIRVTLDVTFGQLSVFISDKPDVFLVRSDPLTSKHIVYPDKGMVDIKCSKIRSRRNIEEKNMNASSFKYSDIYLRDRANLRSQKMNNYQLYEEYFEIKEDLKGSYLSDHNESDETQQNDDPAAKARSRMTNGDNKLKLLIINATEFNTFAIFPPGSALVVKRVQNRLVVSIPHIGYDFHSTKFYMVVLGGRYVMPVFNFMNDDQGANDFDAAQIDVEVIDETAGLLVFRQDQTRIDLFVFFSVFFSCFFLFLAICILIWKTKQTMDVRQARHARHVEMQHMASRPFACVYVSLDDYHADPLLMKKKHPKKNYDCKKATASSSTTDPIDISTSSQLDSNTCMFQARSCPIFTSSPNKHEDIPGTSASILPGIRSSKIHNQPVSEPTSPCNIPPQKRNPNQSVTESKKDYLDLTAKSHPQLLCDSGSSSAEKIPNLRRTSSSAVGSSADQLLIICNTDQLTDHKVPLLNSTSSYITLTCSSDSKAHLSPVHSSSGRTPTPAGHSYKRGVQTVVSLDKGGMVRTLSKENAPNCKSLRPLKRGIVGDNLDPHNSSTTNRPVTKFRSTPNIPERGVSGVNERKHHSLFERQISFEREEVVDDREATTLNQIKSERPEIMNRTKHRIKKHNISKCWEPGPIACEPTEDGLASATTVILCLPGGSQAPVFACLGTGLVLTHNMYYLPVNDTNVTSKTNYKSRTSKML